MIEIVSVLVSLCLISVVLRVVARLRRQVGFGVDDYLSMIALVLIFGMLTELVLCGLSFYLLLSKALLTMLLQGALLEATGPISTLWMAKP